MKMVTLQHDTNIYEGIDHERGLRKMTPTLPAGFVMTFGKSKIKLFDCKEVAVMPFDWYGHIFYILAKDVENQPVIQK